MLQFTHLIIQLYSKWKHMKEFSDNCVRSGLYGHVFIGLFRFNYQFKMIHAS